MMDAAERAMLTTTVRDALATTTDVDAALAGLGWSDMLATEPDDAIAIVFDALGRSNATATAIDDVVLHALAQSMDAPYAVLIPVVVRPDDAITGLATARVRSSTDLLVVRDEGVALTPVVRADVRPVGGIDPDAGMFRVGFDDGDLSALTVDAAGSTAIAVAVARALAHQIAGASRTMLELARDHALQRVQFGRPVAQFQAVRHRLADALVAIETLDATLAAAAAEPGELTAALAKATAGRTARTVGTHCQQVLAGVGFTTEHPFHRFLKRTMLLDAQFGAADDLVLVIGHALLADRSVPTLVEL